MEAALSAEKDGLTGDKRRNFIDQARATALDDYREQALANINAADLTPAQRAAEIDALDETVSDFSNANKDKRNERVEATEVGTGQGNETRELTIATDQSDSAKDADNAGMTGAGLFDALSALGNSAMLGTASLEVAEADPAEEKTASASPILTDAQKAHGV